MRRAVCCARLQPFSTASAQIKHGWLQRRTKRPFHAALINRTLSHTPCKAAKKKKKKAQTRTSNTVKRIWPVACRLTHTRANKNGGTHVGHMCRDNRRRGKPLRQVHLKVLRNWQVDCAMHAWATALWGALHAGPGRYSSLLFGTCTPILSPPFSFAGCQLGCSTPFHMMQAIGEKRKACP